MTSPSTTSSLFPNDSPLGEESLPAAMAEKKRKSKEESGGGRLQKKRKNSKPKTLKKRTGPRLPSKLRKELDLVNPNPLKAGGDEEINSDEGELLANNLYEYEEAAPEEESKKNRRFDSVENFEYELPEDFKVSFYSNFWCLIDSEECILQVLFICGFRNWGNGFGWKSEHKKL